MEQPPKVVHPETINADRDDSDNSANTGGMTEGQTVSDLLCRLYSVQVHCNISVKVRNKKFFHFQSPDLKRVPPVMSLVT